MLQASKSQVIEKFLDQELLIGIYFLKGQKLGKDEFMKPIVCITALHRTTTLEQKLEKDLDSHTFENENRKGKGKKKKI